MEFANKSGVKIGDNSYHIEPNGEIIIIKKP
jgi:hypothetical protein